MSIALSYNDRLYFISNLGTMLRSGIPISDAVESLLEESKGKLRKVLLQLREDLNQGKTIADSFAKFPKTFNPISVNLIRAAEEAGTLDATLKDLSANMKKDMEFAQKVRNALTYPVLVVIVFSGVLLLIITFVIPKIATVFDKLKVDIPLPTRILIATSRFFLAYTPFIIAGAVLLAITLFFLYKKNRGLLAKALFSLPVLSTLGREIDLTRFTRSFALLLSSGIPINEALTLSIHVLSRKDIIKAVTIAREYVVSGKELSDGLRQSKHVIPSMIIRVVEAGEKSGTLESSMQELAEYYDSQVSNTLKRATALLEPIMLIVVGVMIGGMMLSIIAPIYQLIGNIKAR